MKFYKGKNKAQRLERKRLKKLQDLKEKMVWHKVFAWLPVKVSQYEYRWLEYVELISVPTRYAYCEMINWEQVDPFTFKKVNPSFPFHMYEIFVKYKDRSFLPETVSVVIFARCLND